MNGIDWNMYSETSYYKNPTQVIPQVQRAHLLLNKTDLQLQGGKSSSSIKKNKNTKKSSFNILK